MFATKQALQKKQDTKELLIRQGVSMLMAQGYEATSINDVLEAVGVPKGSFYYYFDSKEAFCKAILTYYQQAKINEFSQFLDNKKLTPLNRLRSMLAYIIREQETSDFQCACLVGVLSHEVVTQSEELRLALENVCENWIASLLKCFTEAQSCGELPENIELRPLAKSYMMMFQGAMMQAKLTRSPKPFQTLHWLFFQQLAQPAKKLDKETEKILKRSVSGF